MRTHHGVGARIIQGIAFLEEAKGLVLHHHECYDGSGYPHGLAGEDSPLGARLIAVADAFDALTTDRPYRAALPKEKALERILSAVGTHLCPTAGSLHPRVGNPGRAPPYRVPLSYARSRQVKSALLGDLHFPTKGLGSAFQALFQVHIGPDVGQQEALGPCLPRHSSSFPCRKVSPHGSILLGSSQGGLADEEVSSLSQPGHGFRRGGVCRVNHPLVSLDGHGVGGNPVHGGGESYLKVLQPESPFGFIFRPAEDTPKGEGAIVHYVGDIIQGAFCTRRQEEVGGKPLLPTRHTHQGVAQREQVHEVVGVQVGDNYCREIIQGNVALQAAYDAAATIHQELGFPLLYQPTSAGSLGPGPGSARSHGNYLQIAPPSCFLAPPLGGDGRQQALQFLGALGLRQSLVSRY